VAILLDDLILAEYHVWRGNAAIEREDLTKAKEHNAKARSANDRALRTIMTLQAWLS
jgi:hypothetical protein